MLSVNSLYPTAYILRMYQLILDSQLVLNKKDFYIFLLHTKALYSWIYAEDSIPILLKFTRFEKKAYHRSNLNTKFLKAFLNS